MERVTVFLKYLTLVLPVVFILSCGDDENVTSDGATISITFNTNNSESSVTAGRTDANTLAFTSGTITLTRIEFQAETDEGDSIEVEVEQNIDIDFATGDASVDLENLVFTPGTYAEVAVELELLDENSNPSVVIDGTYTDAQDQEHPIRFEFNSGETFEVEKEGNINISTETQVLAEVTFDPTVWFREVTREELSSASKNNDGVIVISETNNQEIFDIVADGLDLATEVEITL